MYPYNKQKKYNLSKSNTNSKLYKIVKCISLYPGLTKKQILEKVMPESMKNYSNGYYSTPFAGLVKNGILSKGINGRGYYITEKGMKILKEIEEKNKIEKEKQEKIIDLSNIIDLSKINKTCNCNGNCNKKRNNEKQIFELILNNLLNDLEEKYEECGKVISDIITQMQINKMDYKKIKFIIEKYINNCINFDENPKNALLGLIDILIEFEN